jgi:hypothetical protein
MRRQRLYTLLPAFAKPLGEGAILAKGFLFWGQRQSRMAKVVRVGVSPATPGKLKRLDGDKKTRVATIAELEAVFFQRSHKGPCKRELGCGRHCYVFDGCAKLKEPTINQYHSVARKWGAKLDAMGEVEARHVTALMNIMTSKSREAGGQGKSLATANFALHVLRTMASHVADGTDNRRFDRLHKVLKRIRPYKQSRLRPRNPPPDVISKVLPHLTEAEQHFVVLMARLGLRVGEMMALTPDCYVPHMPEPELWVIAGGRDDLRNRKLYEDQLTKRLSPDSCRRLEWLITHQTQMARRPGRAKSAPLPGWLFPWGKNYPDTLMRKIRRALGDESRRYFPARNAWHAFRHLSAYLVVEEVKNRHDAPMRLKEHLGHKTMDAALAYLGICRGMAVSDEVVVDVGEDVQ